jgi:hypothetical protein
MKRLLLIGAIALATALSAQAAPKHTKRASNDVVVWDKESKDPTSAGTR